MAVIQIDNLGGLYPSVSPRALASNAATKANNLMAKTTEFRPLPSDLTVFTLTGDGATTAKTIYRLDRKADGSLNTDDTQGWLSAPLAVNIARGAVDDNKGRVYISDMDGTVAPAVFNAEVTTPRHLGVPAPAKPTAVATTVNEYSVSEDTAARSAIPQAIADDVKASLSTIAVGNTPSGTPTTTSTGWLAHGASTTPALPTTKLGDWAYLVPMTGNAIKYPDLHTGLLETAFGGIKVSYIGNPYWAIPVTMQASGYSLNQTTLRTSLSAIKNPDDGVSQLLVDPVLSNAVTAAAGWFSLTHVAYVNKLAALDTAQRRVYEALDPTVRNTANAATLTSYFSSNAAVLNILASEKDKAIASIVSLVSNTMVTEGKKSPGLTGTIWCTTDNVTSLIDSYISSDSAGMITFAKEKFVADILPHLANDLEVQLPLTGAYGYEADERHRLRFETVLFPQGLETILGATGYGQYFTKEYWSARKDWPVSTVETANKSSDIAQTIAAVGTAATALSGAFEYMTTGLASVIKTTLFDSTIAPLLPTPVSSTPDPRFYIATYVTDWGEESAPSLPTDMLTVDQNDYVTVTVAAPPSARNIVGWRLYRNNSGSNSANFQLVSDSTATQAQNTSSGGFDYFKTSSLVYADHKTFAELQEVCPSGTWLEPPVSTNSGAPYMRGLVTLPNGVMAGFVDNIIAFCEPYLPYAWPIEYQITTAYPIVALGVFGQTLVVFTQNSVDYVSGADPASMSQQKDVSLHACVAPRSVQSVEGGVMYASSDGLCLATSAGVQLVTSSHFTREDWQSASPASTIGAYHEQTYYFTLNPIAGQYVCALHLDSGKLTTVTSTAQAFFTDTITDKIYTANGARIDALFTNTSDVREGTWCTKLIVLPNQTAFAWIKVEGNYTAWVSDAFVSTPIYIRIYVDGKLLGPDGRMYSEGDTGYATIHTTTLTSIQPARLPPGKFLEFQIEVATKSRWTKLVLASSTSELQQV